jgi:hypothetical protein
MGVDIHGWVEIQSSGATWDGVLKIDYLADRAYDMFGCLFGVMNYAHFQPIAAFRGFPADLSEEATRELVDWEDEWGLEPLWPTGITWQELQGLDWEEEALSRPSESSLSFWPAYRGLNPASTTGRTPLKRADGLRETY